MVEALERYLELLNRVSSEGLDEEDPTWDHYQVGIHGDNLHLVSWMNGAIRVMYLWKITLPGTWSDGELRGSPVLGVMRPVYVYGDAVDDPIEEIREGRYALHRMALRAARELEKEYLGEKAAGS